MPPLQPMLAAAAELARPYLPPERLTTELAHEPPARALLDRTADAEMLVLGTTRPDCGTGQPSRAMGPVARACLRSRIVPSWSSPPMIYPRTHPDSGVGTWCPASAHRGRRLPAPFVRAARSA